MIEDAISQLKLNSETVEENKIAIKESKQGISLKDFLIEV